MENWWENKTMLFLYCTSKCPTEAEKIGFVKTHDELTLATKTKPNTTVFYSLTTCMTFEKTTKNQGEESCKNQSENKKSSTFFAAWRKVYYGAAKERWKSSIKKMKKSQLFWDQLYFNCVKSVATLALFPAVL